MANHRLMAVDGGGRDQGGFPRDPVTMYVTELLSHEFDPPS